MHPASIIKLSLVIVDVVLKEGDTIGNLNSDLYYGSHTAGSIMLLDKQKGLFLQEIHYAMRMAGFRVGLGISRGMKQKKELIRKVVALDFDIIAGAYATA
jgi:hypothetical protein